MKYLIIANAGALWLASKKVADSGGFSCEDQGSVGFMFGIAVGILVMGLLMQIAQCPKCGKSNLDK